MTQHVDRRVLIEAFEDGLDDWISLFGMAGYLSRHLGIADEKLCQELRRLVAALIDEGLFRAGTLDEASGEFVELKRPVDDVLVEVCDQWGGWNDHSWWYALWFDLTEQGEAEALQLLSEPR